MSKSVFVPGARVWLRVHVNVLDSYNNDGDYATIRQVLPSGVVFGVEKNYYAPPPQEQEVRITEVFYPWDNIHFMEFVQDEQEEE